MKKINTIILKYGLKQHHREEIKTSCDLYANLFLGYFCFILLSIFAIAYFVGLYNIFAMEKDIASLLFYRSYNGEPTNITELAMSLPSVIHFLIIFVAIFFIMVKGLDILFIMLDKTIFKPRSICRTNQSSFKKMFCRQLTEDEKNELRNI